MLPILLAMVALGSAVPAHAEVRSQDPAIRVWLNKRGYVERMDRVRAYVRTGVDGYVVILHAEPSGRVRVLFPVDPDDDAYVRSGRDYEIRGRGDREAFTVYDGTGPGVVLAAVSRDPFRFTDLTLNRHWDYRAAAFGVGNDPEADLLALVQQMTGGAWFDYDVARYEVAGPYVSDAVGGGGETVHLSFYGPVYGGHYWTGGVGFTIGFGWGDGWYDPWYDPFSWRSRWDPWYWGPCCFDAWYYRPYQWAYYAYPYYPAYYPPRWYGPAGRGQYGRHVYAGGLGRTGSYYAFKSYDDRYGLHPRVAEPRRRTVTSAGFASAPAAAPSSAARRTSARSPTGQSAPGSLEPRRRYERAADGSAILPTITGRRQPTTAKPAAPPARTATPPTAGRRTASQSARPETASDILRRAREARSSSTTPTGGVSRPRSTSGLREIIPRRVGESVAPRAPRPLQGTVGSGRTTNPSPGVLQRRTPTRLPTRPSTTRAPARRSAPPVRSTRPTTRSAPRSPPRPIRRAAPTRGASRSSPPKRPPTPVRRRH